ncbi:MAG: hypothetical protein ACEQSA_06695 [Weeksellaceae bacterium]
MDQKPLKIHIRMMKCFLLYCKRKSHERDKDLSENDVINIERDQFLLYCGSADNLLDLAACVDESSTKQVDISNIRIDDAVKIPESIQTEVVRDIGLSVRGIGLSDEGLKEEKVVSIDVDVKVRHFDVSNDDSFVSQGSGGKDALMKIDSLKYLTQKNLEEATASDDSYRTFIRNSNWEYNPYREECNISNVFVNEIDTVCHLDDRNVDCKPPDKLRERNRSKQEQEERFIADSFDVHGSTDTGSNGYTEVDVDLTLCEKQTFCDIVLMSWDMHPFRDDDAALRAIDHPSRNSDHRSLRFLNYQ